MPIGINSFGYIWFHLVLFVFCLSLQTAESSWVSSFSWLEVRRRRWRTTTTADWYFCKSVIICPFFCVSVLCHILALFVSACILRIESNAFNYLEQQSIWRRVGGSGSIYASYCPFWVNSEEEITELQEIKLIVKAGKRRKYHENLMAIVIFHKCNKLKKVIFLHLYGLLRFKQINILTLYYTLHHFVERVL